jgi:hypothetical protein
MTDLDKQMDKAYSELKAVCSGVRNDYFGLIYLESELGYREKAINQIAWRPLTLGLMVFFLISSKKLYFFQLSNPHLIRNSMIAFTDFEMVLCAFFGLTLIARNIRLYTIKSGFN